MLAASCHQQYMWLFPLLGQELSPLQWKEALYGFSLAYVICQDHYSYALGPLLSHIECVYVSVKHYDIPTVDVISQTVAKWLTGWIHWRKGWFTSWWDGSRFHSTVGNGVRLKTYELLISGIFCLMFWTQLITGNWNLALHSRWEEFIDLVTDLLCFSSLSKITPRS